MEKYSKARLCERAAYVRGLAEGLLGTSSGAEAKILAALLEVVEDMARAVDQLGSTVSDLAQQVDEIDDDLAEVEDYVFVEEDGCSHDECALEGEVECPICHEKVLLNDEMIKNGYVSCPNCGELLEFDEHDEKAE